MRTIVYIDGFNLFYGLLRSTPWLWLDLEKFVRSLLTEKYDIVAIKFFTARIRSDKFMSASPHDQACYLEVLTANPLIQIVEGVYKRFRVKLPFVKEPCASLGGAPIDAKPPFCYHSKCSRAIRRGEAELAKRRK